MARRLGSATMANDESTTSIWATAYMPVKAYKRAFRNQGRLALGWNGNEASKKPDPEDMKDCGYA
jgi:hypothetical protein